VSGANELPLSDLRVIDATTSWGELSSRLLGDLGAEVVKVEPPGGSPSRQHAPVRAGVSLSWAVRNGGKRSAVLDPGADDDWHRLLAGADVLVTNDPSAAELAASHPHLVVGIVTPFGLTGPWAGRPATDAVIAGTAGQAFKAGIAERRPIPPPSRFCDDIAAATFSFVLLCAVREQRRSGTGDVLDLAVNDAVAAMSDWSMPNGIARARAGIVGTEGRKGSGPVYPVFRCRDGFVRLIVLSPRQWHAMRAWLGEPDYLQDPELDGFVARFQLADAVLNPLYEEHFADMAMEELSAEAQRRGIVCTPVLPPAGVLANEHLAARGTFREQEVATGVRAAIHAGFTEIDGTRVGPDAPAPALDADRDAVLAAATSAEPRMAAPSAADPAPRPLTGLRVMDFGHGAVGVEVGRLFAEQGADVIKIESSLYPDFIRLQTNSTNTPSFTSSSRSKRGFGVNAKSATGHDLLLRLAARSDLVIENNATGVMDELGLGAGALHEVNPGIVMMSSQLMGTRGPWAHWRGYGPSTLAPSGVVSLWDYPDGDAPAGGGTIFPDQFVGRLGAVASLAAILGRESGRITGTHLELAQIEAAAGVVADLLAAESVESGSARPLGDGHESAAPWGLYPCAGDDQWVAITCRDDADWRGLLAAMGATDGADWDEPTRRSHDAEIRARIEAWTSALDKYEVADRCAAHGVPAGPMLTGVELATDPQLVARDFPVEIDQPDIGPLVLEGPSYRARRMPAPYYAPAPRLGEHTREIAIELLGLDDAAIEQLGADGVLESPTPATDR
jgi:crotonobetainyl-CoA:carnitine CoA-transferase CaiB-like acyl-CoA transferase